MSMYAVKNEDDKLFVVRSNDNAYLYQDQNGNLGRTLYRYYNRKDAQHAIERAGHVNQCHVVTLIEESEKVVLTKEQAEIVERAHEAILPATHISNNTGNSLCLEKLLMNAYVNGYTVEKPKLWNVKVPHTGAGWWYAKPDLDINHGKGCARPAFTGINNPQVRLTDAEIIKYGLQDCEKMEVKD